MHVLDQVSDLRKEFHITGSSQEALTDICRIPYKHSQARLLGSCHHEQYWKVRIIPEDFWSWLAWMQAVSVEARSSLHSHSMYGDRSSPRKMNRRWRWRCFRITNGGANAINPAIKHRENSDDPVRPQTRKRSRAGMQNVQAGGRCLQRRGHGS